MEAQALLLSAALIAVVILFLWYRYAPPPLLNSRRRHSAPAIDQRSEKNPYQAIEPLADFDWASTPPLRIRPFKPKYHLTMALENMPLSELVAMDNTYLDRARLRRSLMDDHPVETKHCRQVAQPAVLEFYRWMVSTYLPQRFPTIYHTTPTGLYNTATQTTLLTHPTSPLAALDTLGEHVDTDFLFLLPSSTAPDGSPTYHLQAFITCFPSGFSTLTKCGHTLAAIHAPVPGYAAKIEKSMDRFFAKLEVGRAVKRANWTVTTSDVLYKETGTHLYADEQAETPASSLPTNPTEPVVEDDDIERQKREVIIENCRLRCERQTLHRLPETKALVFAFKTYSYTLAEVKAEEGAGAALAEAIAGLGRGSVPEMAFYKSEVVWGDRVVDYLLLVR